MATFKYSGVLTYVSETKQVKTKAGRSYVITTVTVEDINPATGKAHSGMVITIPPSIDISRIKKLIGLRIRVTCSPTIWRGNTNMITVLHAVKITPCDHSYKLRTQSVSDKHPKIERPLLDADGYDADYDS